METTAQTIERIFQLTPAQTEAMVEFDRLMDLAEGYREVDQLAEYDWIRAKAFATIHAVGLQEPR